MNISKETKIEKEKGLIAAYIVSNDLLHGSFFQVYDFALQIAEKFLEMYPHDKDDWGINEEWDETVEAFVKQVGKTDEQFFKVIKH